MNNPTTWRGVHKYLLVDSVKFFAGWAGATTFWALAWNTSPRSLPALVVAMLALGVLVSFSPWALFAAQSWHHRDLDTIQSDALRFDYIGRHRKQ